MHRSALIINFVAMFLSIGCASPPRPPTGRSMVVWLSIDGLRHDYVARDSIHLPTLTKLMHEGEYTQEMAPVFPSITWPSHVSEATGVVVAEHGIVNNSFRDMQLKKTFSGPTDSSLIQAEPIWITAPRQHIRTAVLNWPMCGEQVGIIKSDYAAAYDPGEDDLHRLNDLLRVWRDDDPKQHANQPLRLLMGYVSSIDQAGHRFGPDAQGTKDALIALDHQLADFVAQMQIVFAQKMRAEDRLYFLITTDHGMSALREQFVIEDMIGAELASNAHIVNGGCVCNIYLDDLPVSERLPRADAIVKKLHENPIVQAWKRDDLPSQFRYNNPTRTGDVVALAKVGYSWRNKPASRSAIAWPLRGNHGYWIGDDPDMFGLSLIWSPGHSFGGKNLGAIDSLQFHPTIAKLLGIQPASGAKGQAIDVR